MQFNLDPSKQANEVIFSKKTNSSSHRFVSFNGNNTNKYPHHKHLGIVLDSKLDVDQKSFMLIKKCNNLIGL